MSNGIGAETVGKPAQDNECPIYTWCEQGKDHHPSEHNARADAPPVTATADRSRFRTNDDGQLVPEVCVDLYADTSFAAPRQWVNLTVHSPGGWLDARMTLHEADLLRRHLVQLLREVEYASEQGDL